MANGRFDNIRYYDDTSGSFKIPSQVKVYNGSTWVDYGTKDSYNTNKINVVNDNAFVCLTYYRHDVDIPKSVNIGNGKYIDLYRSNGSLLPVNTYTNGYIFEAIVECYSSTSLYTAYAKNIGDINKSYTSYVLEVNSENRVRFTAKTHFSGNSIGTGKYVDSSYNKSTSYCFNVGQKVRIYITKTSNSGNLITKIYDVTTGAELYSGTLQDTTHMTWTLVYHRFGYETTDKNGTQKTYGDTKLYSAKLTPTDNRSQTVIFDLTNIENGTTKIVSTGTFGAYGMAKGGTSVYGEKYTEYLRQTI